MFGDHSPYVGALALHASVTVAHHPLGALQRPTRLEPLMSAGGVADCAGAHNCERVCPRGLPLVASLGAANREVNRHLLKRLFGIR